MVNCKIKCLNKVLHRTAIPLRSIAAVGSVVGLGQIKLETPPNGVD